MNSKNLDNLVKARQLKSEPYDAGEISPNMKDILKLIID